jgi:hypothetical protein
VLALVVLVVASVLLSVSVDSKTGGGDGGGGDMGMGDAGGIGGIGDLGDLGGLGDSGGTNGLGDDTAGGDQGDFGDIGGDAGGDTGDTGGDAGGASTGDGSSGGSSGSSGGGSSGSSGGGSSSSSGGSDAAPPPDPTADAFKAVSPGDCLKNWHTGSDWSSTTPVKASCGSNDGIMFVTSVKTSTGACPSGAGQSYLSYRSGAGDTTALCMTRQFKEGYCFLGKQEGDKITDGNLMSLVECTAGKVPQPWNQIMHITGVYAAPGGQVSHEHCARVQGDQTYYWHWVVDDGKTLVCTMVYGS